ncbi:MAG: DUF1501 domain-containing protein [Planctomycetes bacterium]|nr:DUF1501 domain-containing protein [Planctomycetota bacterium]
MNDAHEQDLPSPRRRDALKLLSCGFGYLALRSLLAQSAMAQQPEAGPLDPKQPHFPPRAKRVIYLSMAGAPSHVDTFDYKPELAAHDGQSVAGKYRAGAVLMASPWKFAQHGKGGLWISELFPELAKQADRLCLLRGMQTDVPAHPQAVLMQHTGSFQFVRPSLGAWTLYGLGTVNQNLPGFVTIDPPSGTGGAQNYGSAFLPATFQGLRIGSGRGGGRARRDTEEEAVANIHNERLSTDAQRKQLDLLQSLNREHARREHDSDEVEGVIQSYELAFRMQAELPQLLDLSKEKPATLEAYGIGGEGTDKFGRQCLMARHLAEAGVRFIEVTHGGWDQHRNLREDLPRQCKEIDKPIAALLADLDQRGMLKDTLVVWGGEFGRTPYAQNGDGRDHNNKGFTTWMAGGGVKGGFSYGATDENGIEAIEGKMKIPDWHATILYLLGLDHERLTFNYAGRDFRLTNVSGEVAKEILA